MSLHVGRAVDHRHAGAQAGCSRSVLPLTREAVRLSVACAGDVQAAADAPPGVAGDVGALERQWGVW